MMQNEVIKNFIREKQTT